VVSCEDQKKAEEELAKEKQAEVEAEAANAKEQEEQQEDEQKQQKQEQQQGQGAAAVPIEDRVKRVLPSDAPLEDRLKAFYEYHQPEKLDQPEQIARVAAKMSRMEDRLNSALKKKYGVDLSTVTSEIGADTRAEARHEFDSPTETSADDNPAAGNTEPAGTAPVSPTPESESPA